MANSLVLLLNGIFQTVCQSNVEAWNAPPTQNHLELANVVLHFCWCSQWCVGWVLRWSLPICGRLSQGSVHSCSHMLHRRWVWATLKLNRHSTIANGNFPCMYKLTTVWYVLLPNSMTWPKCQCAKATYYRLPNIWMVPLCQCSRAPELQSWLSNIWIVSLC